MTNTANKPINKTTCKFKIILHLGLICLFVYLFIGLFLPIANGQTMSNENYILRTENFNTVSSATTEDNKSKFTAEKPDRTISEGVNFKAVSGFKDLAPTSPFSVTLSSDIVYFGTLSPTNPIIRFLDLDIYSLDNHGYSVQAFEDQPLTMINQGAKIIIPDTTCDNGGCGTENAGKWTNILTYGFGYRCDNLTGTDCDNSFAKADLYRRFPNVASNDDYQSIMSGVGSDYKKVRIFYKINTSGAQVQGNYSNVITYIAIPNF
jgi:hypothetical protein